MSHASSATDFSPHGEAVLSPPDGSLAYMPGFRNGFSTEAVAGALPIGRNSPQRPPLGLYAEQFSGSAFTAPRARNRRTWFYRIRPSVSHGHDFKPMETRLVRTAPCRDESEMPISQLRWRPIAIPDDPCNFLSALRTIVTTGDAWLQTGMAAHVYLANEPMGRRYYRNLDGELLLVPQQGLLSLFTECGWLQVGPGEIAIIPRGMTFKVDPVDGPARGFICENYGAAFELPERGPIGANGLANERDFLSPVAAYEDDDEPARLYVKMLGRMYVSEIAHSPLDVVAWHGNCAPVKYDLRRFCPVGSILYDHPDPSIFTVLTSPSEIPGTANVDFVIFPERWLVMENTFRPPWYHRNVMSEFMGLIYGVYDAKPDGFAPGAMSLHNGMLAHGPDSQAFDAATSRDLQPDRLANTLAFMFETRTPMNPTGYASSLELIDATYPSCWDGLQARFKAPA
ncbi:MAG: homogentisate 1,2-dioxygenase [Candidatus Sphingomonas phytovorans]|nr:homogentisate 1,2-dioxygenase [Sphingomonas sp.]WEK02307.1 MAG: homogentisate 1,2-dioxygenase [Sphingomonas sp.]